MELQTTLIPLCGEMFICIMHMCIALLEHFLQVKNCVHFYYKQTCVYLI